MGNAASVLKTFYQRLIRRRTRDRWVRDEKKRLLPDAAKPKKGSTHNVLPKRIDEKVFDQIIQQQGITRRSVEVEEPGWTIHEDIHRRQLAILHCGHAPSSSPVAQSFDSMASWIGEGTERRGANFYTMDDATDKKESYSGMSTDEEDELRADYDQVQWVRIDFDNVGNNATTLERIDETAGEQDSVEGERGRCDGEGTTLDEEDVKEGTMDDCKGGTMDDCKGGTMNDCKGGTMDDCKGGTMDDCKGGTMDDVKEGTMDDCKGGTMDDCKGGTMNDCKGGTMDDVKEGTMDDCKGGTMNDCKGGRMDDDDDGTMEDYTIGTADDYDDFEFDEDNQMDPEGTVTYDDDEQQTESDVQNETTGAYALERFAIEIHTCYSLDASWCDKILV